MANRSRAWSILMLWLMAALGIHDASATEGETIMADRLSAMHFERSGGLFALGRPLAGDVAFDPGSAILRSDATAAPRPLTAAERAMFARLDPIRLREFEDARRARPPAPGLPDDYQYDLTLSFAQSGTIRLTFHGQSMDELRAVPGLAELAAWVQAEIDAIWARR